MNVWRPSFTPKKLELDDVVIECWKVFVAPSSLVKWVFIAGATLVFRTVNISATVLSSPLIVSKLVV